MNRYFIYLSYKGTNYHGWQIQENAPTVQGELHDALITILKEEIMTTGAGRTDTGVHAAAFCAHFDSHNLEKWKVEVQGDHPAAEEWEAFTRKLNCLLPDDICVHAIKQVAPTAHARFDALERTYKYYIATRKNPFTKDFAAFVSCPLHIERMNEAAQQLLACTDFTSFAKLHAQTKTNHCRIIRAAWEATDGGMVFTISADRFLRNMVRAIVGTLIDVGRGKITVDHLRRIIEQKDRCRAGGSAPAKGLHLTEVVYPPRILEI